MTLISVLFLLLGMCNSVFAASSPINVKFKGEFNEEELRNSTKVMAFSEGKGFNDLYKSGDATIKINNPNFGIYKIERYEADTTPKYSQKIDEVQAIGIKNGALKKQLGNKKAMSFPNLYDIDVKNMFKTIDQKN